MYQEANARKATVEGLLGYDGKWASMWDRYCRGLVAPSESRLNRIERVLEGTAHYYRSPLWRSYSPRKWSRLELELAVQKLDPSFRYALRPPDGEYDDTHYWIVASAEEVVDGETEEEEEEEEEDDDPEIKKMRVYFGKVLVQALKKIPDPKLGMSAMNTIYLMLQELRMLKKFEYFTILCMAWSDAEKIRHEHPLLKHLPIDIFHQPIAPLAKYLPPIYLEFIRKNRNINSEGNIQSSDIFWFLQNRSDWMRLARTASLVR